MYSTIKHFRDDLTRFPPSFFVCVPLVLDTLHIRVTLYATPSCRSFPS